MSSSHEFSRGQGVVRRRMNGRVLGWMLLCLLFAGAPLLASESGASAGQDSRDWMERVDHFFGEYLVTPLGNLLFFDFGSSQWLGTSVPFVVVWLLAGAVFFTVRMGFINLRGFWHAVRLTRGHYDQPDGQGEVSHFQALASALSATVGLGNIAGVAIAVGLGGPGAIFWIVLAGFLGMTTKFVECTLGQAYRRVAPDGTVLGGPMYYLHDGLKEIGLGPLGALLSVMFAVVCMAASLGVGAAFQVGQSLGAVKQELPLLNGIPWVYGMVMAVLVGLVIMGGFRRIASTAGKIVPLMCGLYVGTAAFVILSNLAALPAAFGLILQQAFTSNAAYGGFLGVAVIGIKRAVFSNEAGIGSAAIAHAAAKTREPVSEGIVSLLEPFIDTIVVCTMTGLVIVITGVCDDPRHAALVQANEGAALTSRALASCVGWFPRILSLAVVLFAFSTMISWSYYGERCWTRLFGSRTSFVYKAVFLTSIFLGSVVTANNVMDFADLMILSMAFPNILGLVLLSGKVKGLLGEYWERYKSGGLQGQHDAPSRAAKPAEADDRVITPGFSAGESGDTARRGSAVVT